MNSEMFITQGSRVNSEVNSLRARWNMDFADIDFVVRRDKVSRPEAKQETAASPLPKGEQVFDAIKHQQQKPIHSSKAV